MAVPNSGNKKRVGYEDQGGTSLFQPDVLLSEEYLENHRRQLHLEPEKRLMFAVLEDAVACYQKYIDSRRPREKTLFNETEEWIFSKDNPDCFSFESICEHLGIDPDYFRKGLQTWKEGHLRPKAKVYHLDPNQRSKEGVRKAQEPPKTLPGVLKNGTD